METLFQVFDSKRMAWVWTKGKLKELVHSYCFKICLKRLIVRMKQTNEQTQVYLQKYPAHYMLFFENW